MSDETEPKATIEERGRLQAELDQLTTARVGLAASGETNLDDLDATIASLSDQLTEWGGPLDDDEMAALIAADS